MSSGIWRGLNGCPLCDEPPPHSHSLGAIYNALYYCPAGDGDGVPPKHQWGKPSRWLKRVNCIRCGYRERKR